jgi:hypothetical protein
MTASKYQCQLLCVCVCVCVCVCACVHRSPIIWLVNTESLDLLFSTLTLHYRLYLWEVTHFFNNSKKTLVPYISLFLFGLVMSKILYHLHNTNPWGWQDLVECQPVCYLKHLVLLDVLEKQHQQVKYSGNCVIYPETY